MTKKGDKYRWYVGSPPPTIDPHSLVKHQIVRSYLDRYVQVLMSNVNIEKLTLSIVDGFAGGGEYSSEDGKTYHDGSPLIALNAITEQQGLLNIGREKPRVVDAKYYFVEKERSNHDYLRALLEARLPAGRLGHDVTPICGSFQSHVDQIVAEIKQRAGGERAIFLLDQYAYGQVPVTLLRKIFSQLRGAEVILTFNVDSLLSFLSDTERCRSNLREVGLDRYVEWSRIEALKKGAPSAWRSAIQRNLARGLIEMAGARHYTIFYITPLGSTAWTYWLVHLSNSFKARDVMMELHWQLANHFSHYLEPDLFTLGYRANDDGDATGQRSIDMEQVHHFDAVAGHRCLSGLTQKLVPMLFERDSPMRFGDLLEAIGSSTPATASMIREALDPAIRQGDLQAVSKDGVQRAKGSSLHTDDTLGASAQRPIIFVLR
jgi:three-Cys-motif partner protein